MSVFRERKSLGCLVSELLLIEILSENVGWTGWLVDAVSWDVSSVVEEVGDLSRLLKLLSENVAWLGPTGWTERLAVKDGSGEEEEFLDLAS